MGQEEQFFGGSGTDFGQEAGEPVEGCAVLWIAGEA